MDGAERGAHMASNFTHAIVRRPSRSVIDGIADFANEGKPIYEKALEQHDAYIAALEAADGQPAEAIIKIISGE